MSPARGPAGSDRIIDDGAQRPGCPGSTNTSAHPEDGAGCFSRAVMYRLDNAAMRAVVVWQFEFPFSLSDSSVEKVMLHDVFNAVGGSVYELTNGHFLIGFTSVSDTREYNPRATSYAFEIATGEGNGKVDVKTRMLIPTPLQNVDRQNGYRFTPWHSVVGESSLSPFLGGR